MWLTFRYFFPTPLHSYTTLVLRIALWEEEEVMISSGRLTRPCWRLSFKSLASRMMCWYLILLQILLLLLSGDENWLCPMHHHSWHQIAHQCVSLRRRRRYSWWLMLMIVIDDVQSRYQRRERSGIRQRLQSKDWRMVLAIDRVREQSQVVIGGASDGCLVNNCHLSPTYRLALRWCPVGRAA